MKFQLFLLVVFNNFIVQVDLTWPRTTLIKFLEN